MKRLAVITGLYLLLQAPAALADDCPPCPCAAGPPVALEIPGLGTVVVSNGGPTRPAARGTTKRSTTKRSTTKRKHRHPRRKRPGASTTPKFTG